MTIPKRTKQPGETLEYPVSFVRWARGRTDAAASFTADVPAGLTLEASSLEGWVVWLVLKGGTAGQSYKITVRLSTNSTPAIVKEVEFVLQVREI